MLAVPIVILSCSARTGHRVEPPVEVAGSAGAIDTTAGLAGNPSSGSVGLTLGGTPPVETQRPTKDCPLGSRTSVSGVAFAPNGTLPLYNVRVYVPNGPLAPLAEGVSCDRCSSGIGQKVLSSAVTDAAGAFKLLDVPAGSDIPLVVQVGKWRRQALLKRVEPCVENVLSDPNLTRLPRNRREGDMPKIALTTGWCDNLGCLLPKLGVSLDEIGNSLSDSTVTYYDGINEQRKAGPNAFGPPDLTLASDLWGNFDTLARYDLTLFSCNCREPIALPENAFANVSRFLDAGGRVFGTDYQYVWYSQSPEPALRSAVTILPGEQDASFGGLTKPITLETGFPKGKALADWLQLLDPAAIYGQLLPAQIFGHITSTTVATQVWARSANVGSDSLQARVVTTNAPAGLPPEQQCGKGVHLDFHLSNGNGPSTFPDCTDALTPGERVLAFFVFDLASCIQDDSKPLKPPK